MNEQYMKHTSQIETGILIMPQNRAPNFQGRPQSTRGTLGSAMLTIHDRRCTSERVQPSLPSRAGDFDILFMKSGVSSITSRGYVALVRRMVSVYRSVNSDSHMSVISRNLSVDCGTSGRLVVLDDLSCTKS